MTMSAFSYSSWAPVKKRVKSKIKNEERKLKVNTVIM